MIEQREPGSSPVKEVRRRVEEIYATLDRDKRKPHYDRLLALISTPHIKDNLAKVDLEGFYATSVPQNHLGQFNFGLKEGNSKSEILAEMVEKLRDVPDTDGVPAVVNLVTRVATAIRVRKPSGELAGWVDKTAQEWNISEQQIATLRAKVAEEFKEAKKPAVSPSAAQRPYILMKLEPASENREKLSAAAWIYSGPDEIDYEHDPGKGELYTASSIEQLLHKLVERIGSSTKIDRRMKGQYAIDFFLPRALFSCPVETWLYDGQPLGIQCQVVIRSGGERLRDGTLWSRWENKWTRLNDLLRVDEENNLVHWVKGCVANN